MVINGYNAKLLLYFRFIKCLKVIHHIVLLYSVSYRRCSCRVQRTGLNFVSRSDLIYHHMVGVFTSCGLYEGYVCTMSNTGHLQGHHFIYLQCFQNKCLGSAWWIMEPLYQNWSDRGKKKQKHVPIINYWEIR